MLMVLLFFHFSLKAQSNQGDKIIGQYWTENKEGKIEIFKREAKYFGKIIWRKEVIKDTKNPNKSLRDRSVIGIEFLIGFVFNGKSKWEGGTVYSIDNGGTYRGKIWLEDQGKTLKMRGYWGISFIGRTATLLRVE